MKRLILLLILTLVVLPSCDIFGSTPSGPTYPRGRQTPDFWIFSSFPKHGTAAHQSKLITQAIDLAIEQATSSITPTVKIEHVALDGGSGETGDWTPEHERENVTIATNNGGTTVAYIGPYTSGATGISLPITNKNGLLQLSPTATWPGLTLDGWNEGEPETYYPSGSRNFARLMPPDSAQGTAAAQWSARLGAKSAHVVSDGSTYSDGLAKQFTKDAKRLGLEITGESKFDADADKVAAEVAASGADAVFYAPSTVEQAVKIAKSLNNVRLPTGVFVSDTALSDQFIEAVGNGAENWHFLSNDGGGLEACQEDGPPGSCFQADFRQRYGEEPTAFAENAFVLTKLVLDSIARGAGGSGRGYRYNTLDWVLDPTGTHRGQGDGPTFDANGDITRWEMGAYRLQDGRFVAEEPISSAPAIQATPTPTNP
jgi:branched-chain amino acid transport system substrate-binding protein